MLVTHGYTAVLARYLRENGREAYELAAPYSGESLDEAAMEGTEQIGE